MACGALGEEINFLLVNKIIICTPEIGSQDRQPLGLDYYRYDFINSGKIQLFNYILPVYSNILNRSDYENNDT
jgi:hypothetical protein